MGNFVLDMLRGNGNTQPNNNQQGINPLGGILKLFSSIANSQNPDQAFAKVAQQNEQIQGVMKMVNEQYNGDEKAAFYAKAKEMGVDPNDILGMLGYKQ